MILFQCVPCIGPANLHLHAESCFIDGSDSTHAVELRYGDSAKVHWMYLASVKLKPLCESVHHTLSRPTATSQSALQSITYFNQHSHATSFHDGLRPAKPS